MALTSRHEFSFKFLHKRNPDGANRCKEALG